MLNLPNNKKVKEYLKIKGFGNENNLYVFNVFFNLHQTLKKEYNSNFIEFGVYFGRTAKLIYDQALNTGIDFNLELVDINERGLINNLFNKDLRVKFHEMSSEKYVLKKNKKKYDFCHLDSNHHYDTLMKELNFIKNYSNQSTLIVVDDFNLSCPQVMKACFDFCSNSQKLFNFNQKFEIILTGFNKAYIVTTQMFSFYEKFILEQLQSILLENNIKTRLGRSELKELRCFNIITSPNNSKYAIDGHLKEFYNPT
tara:strand:+ start:1192 stop:1956 length:765 start_codon:yes stop_codon:yes gene_type:complete